MHILVRDTSNVNVAEVTRDAFECPVSRAHVLAGRACPEDTIDVVCAREVGEAISLRGECRDFFALKDVEGVYARRTVTMGSQGVNVAQEGSICSVILELSRGV